MVIDILVFSTLSVLICGFLFLAYLHEAAGYDAFRREAVLSHGPEPEKDNTIHGTGTRRCICETCGHTNQPVNYPAGQDIQNCSAC